MTEDEEWYFLNFELCKFYEFPCLLCKNRFEDLLTNYVCCKVDGEPLGTECKDFI